MSRNLLARLREDISITQKYRADNQSKTYLLKNLGSGETFEFGEEEFFLCQALDGISTAEQVIDKFNNFFGKSLTEEDLSEFIAQIEELGLIEFPSESELNYVLIETNNLINSTLLSREDWEEDLQQEQLRQSNKKPTKDHWCLFNPAKIFCSLVILLKPFRFLFIGLVWFLIPAVPIAGFTFLENQTLLFQDIALLKTPLSYFGSLLFSLILVNLFSRIALGIVSTYYGTEVKEFGIRLKFGIIPRFYIDKSGIKRLDRQGKLWTYGTSILFRLFLFTLGVYIWYWFRGTGTQLSIWGISVAQAGLIGLLLVCLPIRTSDGYRWFVLFFNLPPSILQRAIQVLLMTLKGQSLPTSISSKEKFILILYGLILFFLWGLFFIKITTGIAAGLESSFPEIFGRATGFILLSVIAALILRWLLPKLAKLFGKSDSKSEANYSDLNVPELATAKTKSNSWLERGVKLLFLFGLGLLLCLPCPYRPGGEIKLLPPQQQAIQAPISGKIISVAFSGGNGELIKAGDAIAKIRSTDIENQILTLQEQVNKQQANLEERQANLNKLLANPRKEEVEVAKAQVKVAEQEVSTAKAQVETITEEVEAAKARLEMTQDEVEATRQQLKAAIVSAKYSHNEVLRLEELYNSGAIALQQVEDARKTAETDKINIEEKRNNLAAKEKTWREMRQNWLATTKKVDEVRQNLATRQKSLETTQANLQLVLSGSPQQDIEAARQAVEAASAELRRMQQELKYAREQEKDTELLMPFDGYLVDSYLNQKVGSFLNQGDTFTLIQNDSRLIGEMKLPEYDAGEIPLATTAEVKLLAYPNEPIPGKVFTIEPTSSQEEEIQIFKVLIELSDSQLTLKPGMSGYGKIDAGKKPVIILLTRPLIRFVQIELWSWLP
jgi:multidrug efflux pump subunit AcrA (membrane-fusion protein)